MATKRKKLRSGKGSKKYERNKMKCEIYRAQHRREKNKIRKIKKHLKKHPNDKGALSNLKRFEELI